VSITVCCNIMNYMSFSPWKWNICNVTDALNCIELKQMLQDLRIFICIVYLVIKYLKFWLNMVWCLTRKETSLYKIKNCVHLIFFF
jgi:hypothetical protein